MATPARRASKGMRRPHAATVAAPCTEVKREMTTATTPVTATQTGAISAATAACTGRSLGRGPTSKETAPISTATPPVQTHHATRERAGSSSVPHGANWQAAPVFNSSGCGGAHRLAATITATPMRDRHSGSRLDRNTGRVCLPDPTTLSLVSGAAALICAASQHQVIRCRDAAQTAHDSRPTLHTYRIEAGVVQSTRVKALRAARRVAASATSGRPARGSRYGTGGRSASSREGCAVIARPPSIRRVLRLRQDGRGGGRIAVGANSTREHRGRVRPPRPRRSRRWVHRPPQGRRC